MMARKGKGVSVCRSTTLGRTKSGVVTGVVTRFSEFRFVSSWCGLFQFLRNMLMMNGLRGRLETLRNTAKPNEANYGSEG